MSPLPYYTTSQARTLNRVLKQEPNQLFSRRTRTLLAGDGADRVVEIGTVLGRRLFGTATAAVVKGAGVDGGTGDGGLGAVTKGLAVKAGVYTLTCIAEAANAGIFAVIDPDGFRLPDATVAVAYTHPQINFTISDGANDFDLGDAFTITVAEGDLKVVEIDFDAVDGSQRAFSIAADNATAPDGSDIEMTDLERDCIVDAGELIWPADTTDDQKAAALATLERSNIFAWTGA